MSLDLVVIGLGYVGLPLAEEACRSGLKVAGLDLDQRVIASLNGGASHIDDLSDEHVAAMLKVGFTATSDASVIEQLGPDGAAIICVPTPLAEDGGPDLTAVLSAARGIVPHLPKGALMVLESTTWPGTTDELLAPMLRERGLTIGEDVFLAFSPERIDPGNPVYGFRNTPKVVGGVTPACSDRAAAFYGRLVDQVVKARGTREAEMAKLLENTYRHVNIALVNEMAQFCHELDIDLWDVINCAKTKPFGFQAFYPGPGVGGHCIPIDPNYLSYRVRAALGYPFRFVELAQEINHQMPEYVVRRIQDCLNDMGKPLRGSSILLLGVTYKADISDQRESPAVPIAKRLTGQGADVSFHDPHVQVWTATGTDMTCVDDLNKAVREADLVVLLQQHASYDTAELSDLSPHLLDTRGSVADHPSVERL